MSILSNSNNDVQVQIKSTADTDAIKTTTSQLKDLGSTTETTTKQSSAFNDTMGNLGRTLIGFGAAYIGYNVVGSITNMGKALFDAAGDLEQTNISFQNLIGNTQQANDLFAQLTQYAYTTPFQSKDIDAAAKQLLAFGQNAEQVTTTVKQLGDVTAAGGGDLQALSLVTGQIFAQGKLRAQDMYQVINDGGAGLVKIMAQGAGGMQALTAEFDTGGIPAQQYFDAINKATADGGFAFQGAAKQATTFNGMLSSLADAATQFGEKLIGVKLDPVLGLQIQPGGIFDKAKDIIGKLTTSFLTMGDKIGPVVTNVVTNLTNFFNTIRDISKEVGDYLNPKFGDLWKTVTTQLFPALKNLYDNVLVPLGKEFGTALVVALGLAIDGINDFLKVLSPVISWLSQHTDVLTIFAEAIGAIWLAFKVSDWVSVFMGMMATVQDTILVTTGETNALKGAWVILQTTMTTPFAVTIIVAAALIALQQIYDAAQKAKGALDALKTAKENETSSAQSIINNANAELKAGTISQAQHDKLVGIGNSGLSDANQIDTSFGGNLLSWWNSLPLFDSGGFTGPGGISDVAGVVHKGEYVVPQSGVDQTTGKPKAMGPMHTTTMHIANVNLYGGSAVKEWFAQQDKDSIALSKGGSAQRGAFAQ